MVGARVRRNRLCNQELNQDGLRHQDLAQLLNGTAAQVSYPTPTAWQLNASETKSVGSPE